jgi:regulatory factor X 1/2/3
MCTLTTVLSKTELPNELVRLKISAVSAFSQTLVRYTSLNHLAQAARAVLNNVSQINQMLADLNRVDFNNVQEQASWVCQCDSAIVKQLETDFKTALSEQRTLEQWADWLESVVSKMLQPYESTDKLTHVARQFLLNWCFYSSMVIRDLTLRSAASFGSFHLIRLLYDEYMFYLVEHRVAQATGETTIAVMGDFTNISHSSLFNPDILFTASGTSLSNDTPPSSTSTTSSSSTSSSLSSSAAATFVASAPISIVNASSDKTQESKGIKRPAPSDDKIDLKETSNNIKAVTGMITIKTPKTSTES